MSQLPPTWLCTYTVLVASSLSIISVKYDWNSSRVCSHDRWRVRFLLQNAISISHGGTVEKVIPRSILLRISRHRSISLCTLERKLCAWGRRLQVKWVSDNWISQSQYRVGNLHNPGQSVWCIVCALLHNADQETRCPVWVLEHCRISPPWSPP